jgi:hypothetical protein
MENNQDKDFHGFRGELPFIGPLSLAGMGGVNGEGTIFGNAGARFALPGNLSAMAGYRGGVTVDHPMLRNPIPFASIGNENLNATVNPYAQSLNYESTPSNNPPSGNPISDLIMNAYLTRINPMRGNPAGYEAGVKFNKTF